MAQANNKEKENKSNFFEKNYFIIHQQKNAKKFIHLNLMLLFTIDGGWLQDESLND